MSTPQSTINVCSGVRLNNSYDHTIWFGSLADQIAWFRGKTVRTYTAYTYLRKSWPLRVQATMQEALTWTYLFFSNGGKTFFYFINNIEYINDNTVEMSLEMDVLQTYHFDYNLLQCFVEREHIALDVAGANIVDEGLEVGEYVSISDTDVDMNDYLIMILATGNPEANAEGDGEELPELGKTYSNVFSGLGVYCAKVSSDTQMQVILNKLDDLGKADMIVAMWMYPDELVSHQGFTSNTITKVNGAESFNVTLTRNEALEKSYTPRNNKLYCYPYNFLYVTNNYGAAAVYPYEYFGNAGEAVFKVVGSVSPDGSVRMYPLNYKGSQHNYESGLTLGSFPTCAWDSDVYKMWLAQNQNQMNVAAASSAIKAAVGVGSAIAGLATGNLVGAGAGLASAYSGAVGIANLMAQKADKAIQPDEAKGNYSATVNMTAGFQTFTIRKKCITRKQAILLDDFFDMFGYKQLSVKVPNRNVRENWTYTKTRGCKITGDFCTEDQLKIESIFDKGVTFWKNGDSIGDYSLSNSCTGGA